MSEPHAFPWDDVMMLSFGVLRWTPEQFWRATPFELKAAMDGLSGGRPVEPVISRDLAQLMQAFPDHRAAMA